MDWLFGGGGAPDTEDELSKLRARQQDQPPKNKASPKNASKPKTACPMEFKNSSVLLREESNAPASALTQTPGGKREEKREQKEMIPAAEKAPAKPKGADNAPAKSKGADNAPAEPKRSTKGKNAPVQRSSPTKRAGQTQMQLPPIPATRQERWQAVEMACRRVLATGSDIAALMPMQSTSRHDDAEICIENCTTTVLTVYWLDYHGAPVEKRVLGLGDQFHQVLIMQSASLNLCWDMRTLNACLSDIFVSLVLC
jgi:hypothetical protein